MLDFKPTIIERALQLARSGNYSSNDQLIRALDREGYDQARLHFDSRTVKLMIRDAMREGQRQAASDEAAFKLQIDKTS